MAPHPMHGTPAPAAPPKQIRVPGLRIALMQEGVAPVPQRLANHPLFLALLAALQRPTQIPAVGWMWGLLVSCVSAIVHDAFTGIYLMAGVFALIDLRLGTRVARGGLGSEPYSAERKRRGRDAKVVTLALLLGLRGVEAWATSWGFLDEAAVLRLLGMAGIAARVSAAGGGVLAALVTAAVWWDEAKSWEHHRRTLGGRPIPVWSALLRIGDAANQRIAKAAKVAGAE